MHRASAPPTLFAAFRSLISARVRRHRDPAAEALTVLMLRWDDRTGQFL